MPDNTILTIPTSPIETQMEEAHDELTDKPVPYRTRSGMIVATFNAARKRRLKMSIDTEIIEAELRSARLSIERRPGCYLSTDGWAAVVEDEQASLFDQAQ